MTLKVAIPNKGQLGDPARQMLREAGYLRSAGARELLVHDPDNDVDFFFLRPKDIATYVGQGTLDLGITGRDMLVDSGAPAAEVVELGFGHSTFRLAAQNGVDSVAGKRIATSYPGLLRDWLELPFDLEPPQTRTINRGLTASELGLSYRPLEETVIDFFQQLVDSGAFETR